MAKYQLYCERGLPQGDGSSLSGFIVNGSIFGAVKWRVFYDARSPHHQSGQLWIYLNL